MRAGIYVHIPFCVKKCRYCSFNSIPYDKALAEDYLKALSEEIKGFNSPHPCPSPTCGGRDKGRGAFSPPGTLYIGGGTPTVIPQDGLLGLVALLYKKFKLKEDAEATLEANPGTLGGLDLAAIRRGGINRVSLGVQSFKPSELVMLGRAHTVEDVKRSVKSLRAAGFGNISLDLIYSLPGQDLSDWSETLARALELEPEHISLYDLSLEEGTELYAEFKAGRAVTPPEPVQVEMYLMAVESLKEAGYLRYEISNFAKDGYECRHNLNYWSCGDYLGFGAGAHSHTSGTRRMNIESVAGYVSAILGGSSPTAAVEVLSTEEMEREFIMLALRKADGLDLDEFLRRFGHPFLKNRREKVESLERAGLAILEAGRLRLTIDGVLASNRVTAELF